MTQKHRQYMAFPIRDALRHELGRPPLPRKMKSRIIPRLPVAGNMQKHKG